MTWNQADSSQLQLIYTDHKIRNAVGDSCNFCQNLMALYFQSIIHNGMDELKQCIGYLKFPMVNFQGAKNNEVKIT